MELEPIIKELNPQNCGVEEVRGLSFDERLPTGKAEGMSHPKWST